MELEEDIAEGVTVLAPVGRVDSANARQFEAAVLARIDQAAGAVLIDLGRLGYISSAGLRVVLLAAKRQQAAGRRFALCAPSPEIREVLEVSGFSKIITIYDAKPAALSGLQSN